MSSSCTKEFRGLEVQSGGEEACGSSKGSWYLLPRRATAADLLQQDPTQESNVLIAANSQGTIKESNVLIAANSQGTIKSMETGAGTSTRRVQSWTLNPFTHGDASAGALLMLRSVLMGPSHPHPVPRGLEKSSSSKRRASRMQRASAHAASVSGLFATKIMV
ncbi:hypothetical protein Anapl_05620 [Anas platyrhynchos]|uniref:Uncharacterized protein n=1 Tax=Anas platyrhynchos TaxID=8839 RepID=R0LIR3_ANAPL|nr:hypothetical protein Anapl_05620 [Anas platyrhynchos]